MPGWIVISLVCALLFPAGYGQAEGRPGGSQFPTRTAPIPKRCAKLCFSLS
jgi:hypothetical protein